MLENLGVILVQIWCNILCDDTHDVHEIARNECFSTIFRGVNASEKTPRDNLCGISCVQVVICLPHTENFPCGKFSEEDTKPRHHHGFRGGLLFAIRLSSKFGCASRYLPCRTPRIQKLQHPQTWVLSLLFTFGSFHGIMD